MRTGPLPSLCVFGCLFKISSLQENSSLLALPSNQGASLHLPLHHHLLDFGDRLRRVEVFGAGVGAVHDGMAAVEPEWVLERIQALAGCFVPRIHKPAMGLQ